MHPVTRSSALQTSHAGHLHTSSSSETVEKRSEFSYVEQLFNLSQVKICKEGIPSQLLTAWSEDICQNVNNKTFSRVMEEEYHWLNQGKFKDVSVEKNFLNPITQGLNDPSFWNSPDPKLRETMLFWLYQLDRGFEIAEDHPNKLVLYKLIDRVIEQIALDKNLQDKSGFSVSVPGESDKSFFCFKTADGWRCGDFDNITNQHWKVVRLNTSGTQILLIDDKAEYVQHQGIIISARILRKNELAHHTIQEQNYLKNMAAKVEFIFYRGSPDISGMRRNSFTITGTVDLHDGQSHLLQGIRQERMVAFVKNESFTKEEQRGRLQHLDGEDDEPTERQLISSSTDKDRLTQEQLNVCSKQVEEIFSIFNQRLVAELKERAKEPVALWLFQPQSREDKLNIICALLYDLSQKQSNYESYQKELLEKSSSKNPSQKLVDDPAQEIAYIAEKLNPTFSEQEIDLLVQSGDAKATGDGTFEVAPKSVLAKIFKEKKTEWLEAVMSAPAKIEKKEEVSVEEESIISSNEAEEKDQELLVTAEAKEKRRLEKEAEKERKRELHKWEQTKLEKKAAASKVVEEEPRPSFELSASEQATVDSIYRGNPVKAKEFKTLAIGLLQKKAKGAEATSSVNIKGSHVKIHLKREDGASSGMTFIIDHKKKKDHMGSLGAQKDALDHIFAL